MSPEHHHTPQEERRIREAALDETLEGTFPASDPSSSIPNPDKHDALVGEERPDQTDDSDTTARGSGSPPQPLPRSTTRSERHKA